MQLSILVGAGLGYAVARSRGGAALGGIAIGAFTGALISTAVSYARYLLKETDNDLVESFDRLGQSAIDDRRAFAAENVPLIEEKEAIADSIAGRSSRVSLSNIMDRLDQIDVTLAKRTIPSPAYAEASEAYWQCVPILPREAQVPQLPPAAVVPRDRAQAEAGRTRAYLREKIAAERRADLVLKRAGLPGFG